MVLFCAITTDLKLSEGDQKIAIITTLFAFHLLPSFWGISPIGKG
jgi:hypothetical protein